MQISYCKINYLKKDRAIKSIFENIISQNKLVGFVVCNLCKKGDRENMVKLNEIMRRITGRVSIVSLNQKVLSRIKIYTKNITRFHKKNHEIEIPLLREDLVAGDRVHLITMISSTSYPSIRDLRKLYFLFSSVQGEPKMLLISLGRTKFKKYKPFLSGMVKKGGYSIDVLEMLRNRLNTSYKYTVIQFNPFSDKMMTAKYSKKTKFFARFEKNLYRRKFTAEMLGPHRRKFVWGTGQQKVMYMGMYLISAYPLEIAFSKLNATLDYLQETKYPDINFVRCDCFPHIDHTHIYPPKVRSFYFMIPCLYDEVHTESYTLVASSLLTIATIVAIFWAWSKFFECSNQTWFPLVIFSMIIGLANPRSPTRTAELFPFISLILVGFFFGCDLIQGLCSYTVVQRTERRLETLDDLKASNISLAFIGKPVNTWSRYDLSKINWISVEPAQNGIHFQYLVMYKNVSVSPCYLESMGVTFPDRITSNCDNLARKSNIKDFTTGQKFVIDRNRPWLHHLNYNMLRFYECSLDRMPKATAFQASLYDYSVGRYIQKAISNVNQSSSKSELDTKYLSILIVLGVFLSLIVLLIEVTNGYCYKNIN